MKPITPENLNNVVYVDDVRISPDGARVAFVRQSIDGAANENVRAIWMKDLSGDVPAQPFTSGRKDSQPRWSEDGTRLGFISGRDGEPGIFVLAMSGGEAHGVATHPNGINSFEWSPDGKRVAFVASVRMDERAEEDKAKNEGAMREDADKQKDAWARKREKEQREHDDTLRFDPRIVHEFPYRTGTNFMSDRWSHVYVMEVPDGFTDEHKAKPRRVTDGDVNHGQPDWSRDGQALIGTLARRPEHTDIEYWEDLIRIPLAGDENPVERLISTNVSHFHPQVSPDGQWIAVQRIVEDRPEFRDVTLAILPVGGGDIIDLTSSLDRSVNDFVWGRDGAHIYFTLMKDGAVNLYRVGVADRVVEQLTDVAHEITSFDVDANGRVVFSASMPGDPAALYVCETDGSVRPLYQPNTKFLNEYEVCPVEEIHYASDEFTIQGWIITPPNFNPTNKYPLALEIHGGPAAMWGAATRSMWHEWQTLAHCGYVVFFCNPRGSGGYGETFMAANCGDWGDGPMRDILRGVDLVVARGYIDTEHMVMTGGSYGGYLTAWIVGRDHRFKAAVAQRGVYNLISMRGVTDIPYFNDRETGVSPWEDINRLWQLSPLSLAPNVQTPLLLEHSELDYRVPISQAEELYLALRTFKKTVELIRWPREGHELSRSGEPKHRVERVKRIVEWFDKYTKG
ncbi:MAG: S9 family peptidase [Chloroflexi bacterium]|nr:S9 family peptidase [Chloroflexota bacterium]